MPGPLMTVVVICPDREAAQFQIDYSPLEAFVDLLNAIGQHALVAQIRDARCALRRSECVHQSGFKCSTLAFDSDKLPSNPTVVVLMGRAVNGPVLLFSEGLCLFCCVPSFRLRLVSCCISDAAKPVTLAAIKQLVAANMAEFAVLMQQ